MVDLQEINTSWTVVFPYAGPLLRLWPWLSIDLQKRLLGIHLRHGKLSVKKVIASLRGASPALARTVALIGQHSEVPDKSHSSAPALESAALKVPSSRTKFNCSPYVLHTCDVLLEKYATTPSSDVKVSCEKFFLTLVDAGPSPLLLQWQKDGITAAKIQTWFKQSMAEDSCVSPQPHNPPPPTVLVPSTALSTRQEKDVFISYSREAAAISFVTELSEGLQAAGYSVWVDTVDIPSGSDWHLAIGEALQKCRALIAVISKKYLLSKYCKNELFMADSVHKPIFPVLLEEVDFSGSRESAGVLYVISSINWVHVKGQYMDAVQRLLEGMGEKGINPAAGADPWPKQVEGTPSKPLRQCSVGEVCKFVSQLEIQTDPFLENSVGGEELLELSDTDMQNELGLRPLQIKKLRKHIKSRLELESSKPVI